MYMFSVSSTLIALGFVSQASQGGEVFQLFALTVLPTLFSLGLFTFGRLVESSIEDLRFRRAINRIRHYYLELAGERAHSFLMSSYDDPRGVLSNVGLEDGSPWRLFFGTASAVSVVNSVVGAGAIAIVLGVTLHLPLAAAAAAGVAFLAASSRTPDALRPPSARAGRGPSRGDPPLLMSLSRAHRAERRKLPRACRAGRRRPPAQKRRASLAQRRSSIVTCAGSSRRRAPHRPRRSLLTLNGQPRPLLRSNASGRFGGQGRRDRVGRGASALAETTAPRRNQQSPAGASRGDPLLPWTKLSSRARAPPTASRAIAMRE